MNGVRLLAALVATLALATAARAAPEVAFPSLDAPAGQPVMLKAYWHPVSTLKGPAKLKFVVLPLAAVDVPETPEPAPRPAMA